jgi:hypothetical protein
VKVEISIGELVDRVTILSIKCERMHDEEKLVNVRYEYRLLRDAMHAVGITERSAEFIELRRTNERLWEIEDKIREKEHTKEFDEEFIQLARSVYFENDTRAAVKRKINLEKGSRIIEEKLYTDYCRDEKAGGGRHLR